MDNDSLQPDIHAAAEDPLLERRAALKRAIDIAEGQLPLAAAIGTTQSQVWYWLERAKKGVPAEFCVGIERHTGVGRHELRPDIFDAPAAEVSQ